MFIHVLLIIYIYQSLPSSFRNVRYNKHTNVKLTYDLYYFVISYLCVCFVDYFLNFFCFVLLFCFFILPSTLTPKHYNFTCDFWICVGKAERHRSVRGSKGMATKTNKNTKLLLSTFDYIVFID